MLFADTLTNPSTAMAAGWATSHDASGSVAFTSGGLTLTALQNPQIAPVPAPRRWGDVRVAVDVVMTPTPFTSTPPMGGVLCATAGFGPSDTSYDYYEFTANPDGAVAIFKHLNGNLTQLISPQTAADLHPEFFNGGTRADHLQVDCAHRDSNAIDLQLLVNGHQAAQYTDIDHPLGGNSTALFLDIAQDTVLPASATFKNLVATDTTTTPIKSLVVRSPAPKPAGTVVYRNPLGGPGKGIGTDIQTTSNYQAVFKHGRFEITNGSGGFGFTETPGALSDATGHTALSTIDLTVTARLLKGGRRIDYGLACRADAQGTEQYVFSIDTDGLAAIRRFSANAAVDRLLAEAPAPIAAIKAGTQPNVIRAVCVGAAGKPATLDLIVNDTKVLEATDSSQPLDPAGTFGIVTQSDPGPSSTVAFQNLIVNGVA